MTAVGQEANRGGSQAPVQRAIERVSVVDLDVPFGNVFELVLKVMAAVALICLPLACFAWIVTSGSSH